jgi:uncharacterized membrane protein YeiH
MVTPSAEASVDWLGAWSLTGSFTTIDLIAATVGALNGALLARRPSHYRNYTVVGVLLMAVIGGISGGVTRDLLVNQVPAALTNPAYLTLSLAAGIVGSLIAFKTGELFREGLFEFLTSASLAWFAIVGAQKGVQVGLPMVGVLALAVVAATAGRYFIDLTCGITPKLFVRGEYYVGTALLAAGVWIVCDSAGLNVWICAGMAFAVGYTVRVLAMWRGWEEPMPKAPPGVNVSIDERPRLGSKLTGKSERELRDLGLLPETGPDETEK